jgi:hypothetical protein
MMFVMAQLQEQLPERCSSSAAAWHKRPCGFHGAAAAAVAAAAAAAVLDISRGLEAVLAAVLVSGVSAA